MNEVQKASRLVIARLTEFGWEYLVNAGAVITSLKSVIVNGKLISVVRENDDFWLVFNNQKFALHAVVEKREVYYPCDILAALAKIPVDSNKKAKKN